MQARRQQRRGGRGWTIPHALAFVLLSQPHVAASEERDPTDLRDTAARVAEVWTKEGAVVRQESRFVMDDETALVDVRPSADMNPGDCRHVALIGPRGMSFHVVGTSAEDHGFHLASAAGVIDFEGCGELPDRLKLKTDSGRGALETVVAWGPRPLPPTSSILLGRTGGTLPPTPELSPLAPPADPRVRASRAEQRLARAGMTVQSEATWLSGDDGKGQADLLLEAGCHRFDLFASSAPAKDWHGTSPLDLDGALRAADGQLLAEDQSLSPDVRLETCVGAPTKVRAAFDGAPRRSLVVVARSFRPLPAHLPTLWGPGVRARLAGALLAHEQHHGLPSSEPVVLTAGAAGTTAVPIELEPGACYLAVATVQRDHGAARGLALRVTARGRETQEAGRRADTAIAAFCADDAASARLEVDARSAGAGWVAAVYRMVGGAWTRDP